MVLSFQVQLETCFLSFKVQWESLLPLNSQLRYVSILTSSVGTSACFKRKGWRFFGRFYDYEMIYCAMFAVVVSGSCNATINLYDDFIIFAINGSIRDHRVRLNTEPNMKVTGSNTNVFDSFEFI